MPTLRDCSNARATLWSHDDDSTILIMRKRTTYYGEVDTILLQTVQTHLLSHLLLIGKVKHTSASLAMNENWDPDVRVDTEMMLNKLIPESTPFRHSCEGPDDMPAHIKALFCGSSVSVPITDGRLNTGTWQGLWLCEHRNHSSGRHLVVTVQGQPKKTVSFRQRLNGRSVFIYIDAVLEHNFGDIFNIFRSTAV